MKNIKVKQLPAMNLAHYKIIGKFEDISGAYEKLSEWAAPKGLLGNLANQMMTIYHKNPEETGFDKVEQSACIAIQDNITVEGEIEKTSFKGGKYVVGSFEINNEGFAKAWEDVCNWAIENSYVPNNGISCEMYHNDYTTHPEKKHIVELCLPVN